MLFIDWNPSIEAFRIGSFAMRWYALCWLIGLLAAYFIVRRLYIQQKIKETLFEPLFIYCFLGILICPVFNKLISSESFMAILAIHKWI